MPDKPEVIFLLEAFQVVIDSFRQLKQRIQYHPAIKTVKVPQAVLLAGFRPTGRPIRHDNEEFEGSLHVILDATLKNDKLLELALDVSWSGSKWLITADVWMDDNRGGMDLLREFPKRFANTLKECASEILLAGKDLAECWDQIEPKFQSIVS